MLLRVMRATPESIYALRRPIFPRIPKYLFAALPICLAYLPIAFAFGVSARNAGLPFPAAVAMSLFVYAGASQMIAVGLMAAGQPLSVILLTTFLVNLRLLLLGTAIAEKVGRWPRPFKVLFGFQHTDETFAALCAQDTRHLAVHRTTNFQTVVHASWVVGTILGHQLSSMVINLETLGLDYALPGMLLGLAGLMVRTKVQMLVGIFSACIALLCVAAGQATWGVLLAASLGPTLGYWLEKQCPRPTPS